MLRPTGMTRARLTAGPFAALLLAACAAGASTSVPRPAGPAAPSQSVETAVLAASAARNRALAQQAVDELVRDAALPPGAVSLTDPPARLVQLGDGHRPVVIALVARRTYWRVPLAQAQVARWFREHAGRGLGLWMDGISGVPKGEHLEDLSFRGPDTGAFDDLTLDVDVASGGRRESLVRIAASAFWLDPTPLPDDASGSRLHVTVAGGCPASPGNAVGVRNDGPPVTDALVPAQTPRRGLVCDYGHAEMHRWKPVQVEELDAAAAARAAGQLRAMPLAHPSAGAVQPRSCPPSLMLPSPTRIVVLAFDGRPDLAVWDVHSCGRWTANGWVGVPLSRWGAT
jgi:hypothetical protein